MGLMETGMSVFCHLNDTDISSFSETHVDCLGRKQPSGFLVNRLRLNDSRKQKMVVFLPDRREVLES